MSGENQKRTRFPCRSRLAGEKRPDNAFIQTARVIVDVHRQQAGSYRGVVYRFGMGERSREEQRVRTGSQVGFQAASAAVAVVAPSRGRAQVLCSGQPGMDAGLAAPGHGWPMAAGPRSRTGASHRTKGARALWLLSRFSKVTRCKSETNSNRYPKNGYVPKQKHTSPTKKRVFLLPDISLFAAAA